MPLSTVRDAYAARSAEYIDLLGSIEDTAEPDREYVLAWAQRVDGRIVDVGCGPGQWTNYLHENGLEVVGVDPVPALIDHARQRYPGATYRVGDAGQLDMGDASLGGVLAWYSLIHTAPDDLDSSFTSSRGACAPVEA
jgi:ubiquinone/menaquinone biosynthesis C-methylase UbiE